MPAGKMAVLLKNHLATLLLNWPDIDTGTGTCIATAETFKLTPTREIVINFKLVWKLVLTKNRNQEEWHCIC